MTKKQADLNGDGKEEDALIAIDNQAFNTKVAYTNVNEPSRTDRCYSANIRK